MHRAKSKERRSKKANWSNSQRLQAVSTYLMLGSLTQTAIVTSIPLPTLKTWKTASWFKEYCLQLQAEDIQQMDSNLKRVVEKSLKAVEDRLDWGDAQFDQRTGAITRIPVKAHVALKITSELLNQQTKLKAMPVKEELEKTIDDRLLRLADEFTRFSSNRLAEPTLVIDINAKQA